MSSKRLDYIVSKCYLAAIVLSMLSFVLLS